jgi:hypothetical protein
MVVDCCSRAVKVGRLGAAAHAAQAIVASGVATGRSQRNRGATCTTRTGGVHTNV